MDFINVILRWLHIVSGILWIGMLYFFNLAYTQFALSLEAGTRKTVMTGLIPRALFWFRWGAAYTWISGLLLLLLVYYHGGLMFESDNLNGWGTGSIVMVAATFLMFAFYDVLAKSPIGKNLMVSWGGFSFRAYNIHIGTMFGTIMAANVWMRIWPAQKKILAAVKEGTAPDQALVASVGARSRHNTYLSIPLIWMMINAHTAVPAADSWLYLPGVILIGWASVALLFTKAGTLKGV